LAFGTPRWAVAGLSALDSRLAALAPRGFGREFMPPLEEGSLLFMPVLPPATSLTEAKRILAWQDKVIGEYPEVAAVAGKLGRADTATDPAPVEMIETTITLKPPAEWRPGMTRERLVAEMNAAMQVVGYSNSWTQPINTRVMMQDTGIQTPVGIKVKGPELSQIENVGRQVEALLKGLPGT